MFNKCKTACRSFWDSCKVFVSNVKLKVGRLYSGLGYAFRVFVSNVKLKVGRLYSGFGYAFRVFVSRLRLASWGIVKTFRFAVTARKRFVKIMRRIFQVFVLFFIQAFSWARSCFVAILFSFRLALFQVFSFWSTLFSESLHCFQQFFLWLKNVLWDVLNLTVMFVYALLNTVQSFFCNTWKLFSKGCLILFFVTRESSKKIVKSPLVVKSRQSVERYCKAIYTSLPKKTLFVCCLIGITFLTMGLHKRYEMRAETLALDLHRKESPITIKEHYYSSKVNVGLSVEQAVMDKGFAKIDGNLWFNFTTGTECLDLLKEFEFAKPAKLTKSSSLAVQSNLVNTSCVFEVSLNVKPQYCVQLFPYWIFKIDLQLKNNKLFPQECSFITTENCLTVPNDVKRSLGVYDLGCQSGEVAIPIAPKRSLASPAADFTLFCKREALAQPILFYLLLTLLFMLLTPLIFKKIKRVVIVQLCTFVIWLFVMLTPYFYFGTSNLIVWSSLFGWQLLWMVGSFAISLQHLAGRVKPPRFRTNVLLWLTLALLSNFVFWLV